MVYTAGLIGTGFIAASHAAAYAAVEGIELVAVSDVDERALADFGEEWSIPADRRYDSHQAMLDAEPLDVVSIASPSFCHHDHTIDAARSAADPGVVWCEKPIALSVADAREMLTVCEASETELVVNHVRRFSESYTTLQEEIAGGLVGEIESIHVQFGRELLRNGTHTVDLVTYLHGGSVQSVTGYLTGEHGMGEGVESGAPDGVYDDCGGGATLVTDDGSFVTVDHTTRRGSAENSVQVIGSDGKLRLLDDEGWTYWRCEETDEGYGIEHVETPLPFDVTRDSERDNFVVGAEHVRDLLDGGVENRSPGSEAAHVLEILVAAFVSHHIGSRIELPLADPLRGVEIFSW